MTKHTLKMLLCKHSKILNAYLDISEAATGGVLWKKVLKKRLWQRCFPVNFAKFLKNTFFTDHLRTTASDISQRYAWKDKNLQMQFFWPEKWKLFSILSNIFPKTGIPWKFLANLWYDWISQNNWWWMYWIWSCWAGKYLPNIKRIMEIKNYYFDKIITFRNVNGFLYGSQG